MTDKLSLQPADKPADQKVESDLRRLRDAVDTLIRQGATGPDASDAQKWAVGDMVNRLSALSGAALGRARRKSVPSSTLPPKYQAKVYELREKLLSNQGVTRNVLVDYGRVAAVIGPDDPLRNPDHLLWNTDDPLRKPGDPSRKTKLTFFFARALSVIKNPAERLQWAEEARKNGYSVARLRSALNASRGKKGTLSPQEGSKPPAGQTASKTPAKKRRGVYVCASTGKDIVDIPAMVEVHLDRGHPAVPPALPERNRYAVLRFQDLSALAAWSAIHQGDVKSASIHQGDVKSASIHQGDGNDATVHQGDGKGAIPPSATKRGPSKA